ncbi:MAG: DNA-binding response regulator, partial [Bullifex sp.]
SLLRDVPVDLVIFDIMMPEMNGAELSSVIHRDHPGVRMLAMSSFDDFDYVRDVLINGASDYMLKHRLNGDALRKCLAKIREELSDNKVDDWWKSEYGTMISAYLAEKNSSLLVTLISDIIGKAKDLRGAAIAVIKAFLASGNRVHEDILLFNTENLLQLAEERKTDELLEMFRRIIDVYTRKSTDYSPSVSAAFSLIDSNYPMNLTLDDAASVIGVNASYLSRQFHKETGCTFTEALTHRRTEAAKIRIKDGENLKSVASDCGFKGYNYFFRVFKKETGYTPVQYQKEIAKVKNLL